MKILITGGAGYIGSHVLKQLLEFSEHELVVVDNLSTGSEDTLKLLQYLRSFEFLKVDLADFQAVKQVCQKQNFDAIMHFAASIVVPESVQNPTKYYLNNTANTTNLIQCAQKYGVKKFIFSSTAAVYGEPKELPSKGIDEDFETKPINPYGMSKLMSEHILKDTAQASSELKYVIFRYFNVAGADMCYEAEELKPRIGQSTPNATHLIKIASQCASGKREKMSIFGDTYPTYDGTCIRDYIHVDDLADAHIQALQYLEEHESDTFNLGYGKGYSVKEVIDTMKSLTCKDFQVELSNPRAGDPAKLIANNTKITEKMNWQVKYDDLKLICQSSYEWEKLDEQIDL